MGKRKRAKLDSYGRPKYNKINRGGWGNFQSPKRGNFPCPLTALQVAIRNRHTHHVLSLGMLFLDIAPRSAISYRHG
jgi:hypothetical protein